jgi:hypothetical protein
VLVGKMLIGVRVPATGVVPVVVPGVDVEVGCEFVVGV